MRTLDEIFKDAGLKTRPYSGRNMYGGKCLGVVAEGCGKLLAAVAESPDAAHWAQELKSVQEDGMGSRASIFYFPDVDPPEEEFDDEDDD